ncbi:MAG: hypothetical protein IPJ41_03555 [Phycisphaerales bacterium]|nr:hypothetical protein [Phycisphaerales bacterium]
MDTSHTRRRARALGAALVASLAWAAAALAGLDVRTPVVCMPMGAVALDSEGHAGPLYWPTDPTATRVFMPLIASVGAASVSVVPDPADPTRRLAGAFLEQPNSAYRVFYSVGNGVEDATVETPRAFWFESTFRFDYSGEMGAATDRLAFLDFRDEAGGRVQLRLRGGSPPAWQLVNLSGTPLPAPGTLLLGNVPQPGRLYAFRLQWTSASAPDGSDGVLRLVTIDVDSGSVLDDTTIPGCTIGAFQGFTLQNANSGSGIASAQILWDHVTYSAIQSPGDMGSPSTWASAYRIAPPTIGAQRSTPGSGDRIEVRALAAWPDSDLGDRLTAGSAAVTLQYRRLGDAGWIDAGPALDARESEFGLVSETISGLTPLTNYEFRARYSRDGVPPVASRSAIVRTLSADTGEPGTIRLGSYSCVSAKKAPTYAPETLARLGADEVQCLGDISYTNTDMGYNRGLEYFAYGDFTSRRLEWYRLLFVQLLGPTMAQGAAADATHWIMTDDHCFRDDLAGANKLNLTGVNHDMIEEIAGFVGDSLSRLSWPADASTRRYWWERRTARTLSLFLECRQFADHGQNRTPDLPIDSALIPWNGDVETGAKPLVLANDETWGTTVLGAPQTAEMLAAIRGTDKPIVIFHAPVMVANGSQREYQDLGTYPEIWQLLEACEENPRIRAVLILSGDLHLAMVIPGGKVPSAARMAALGMPASYPKLLWEALIGGGGQGGHRLRWQVGNILDNDSGLRGGDWAGAAAPRWVWASDFNSRWPGDETVPAWDYDKDHAQTWDGSYRSGIGNTAKQEHAALLTIDERSLNMTLRVIDLQTERAAYTRIDRAPPPSSCIADWNSDGTVDTRDVVMFLQAWSAREPAADLNRDGLFDTRDVTLFFGAWAGGC